jgi:hypothetical protein
MVMALAPFLFLLATMTEMTMPGLEPASSPGFMVEVKTAASPHTAIGRSQALERRLGRPGEGTLLRGELRQEMDDLVNGK